MLCLFLWLCCCSPLRDQVERLDAPLTGDVRLFLLKVLSNIDKFTDFKVNKKTAEAVNAEWVEIALWRGGACGQRACHTGACSRDA